MRFWKVALLLFVSIGQSLAGNGIPQKEAFAWGMELELADTSPFYRITLPLEVYAGVVRPDLGDIRVLNGQGSVVPQSIELPPVHQTSDELYTKAKVFPLYGSRDTDIETILIQSPKKWQEDRVSIATRERFTSSDEVLRGYILQLGEKPVRAAKQLHLEWREESRGAVHRLKVEFSNDLAHWRTHNASAVIADLRYGGERLLKQEIPLGNLRAKYLRLSPANDSKLIDLLVAKVEFAGDAKEVIPNRLVIEKIEPGEHPGEYLFLLPGPLSAASMDILPSEINTLLRASLYSRAEGDQSWVRRGSGLIYKLVAEGEPLQQSKIRLSRTRDRYWKLVIDTSGGGFGAAQPELVLGWMPHRLMFAARGQAPFMLVYGSGQVDPVSGSAVLSGFDKKRLPSLTSQNIRISKQFEISGPAVLAKKVAPDWKSWILWGVLVLGTVILGWMAWSTLRKLST